ncbi:MAG: polyprenyl synthetase family protein [Clostridiaceae bacterium]|nr:polyprenyl synthetase family protein [Clostridiaceae bacterium]
MTEDSFTEVRQVVTEKVNRFLQNVFNEYETDLTAQAALYSLLGGGKRLRPLLTMIIGEMLSVPEDILIPFAGSIEMIHTYSLIHDDLPCMDDDSIRRGRATCHVEYDEATALLAGDALLNRAYEILFEECISGSKEKGKAASYIARCSGIGGMIGGQSEDIHAMIHSISPESLYSLHKKKTGALISASILVPHILKGEYSRSEETRDFLFSFAEHLGLSFQIKDDLLDYSSTTSLMGKTVGKDEKAGKATFVTVFGLQKARSLYDMEMKAVYHALNGLARLGYNTVLITDLTDVIHEREN